MALILKLDSHGQPISWITWDMAITYYAKSLVLWEIGENKKTVYGGINHATGKRSVLSTAPIIAVRGTSKNSKKRFTMDVCPSNRDLFRRDNNTCAYCGYPYPHYELTRDHIIPRSKGGMNTWENLVTSCSDCNAKKADKTISECGMSLLFKPYVPTRAEHLILSNRSMLPEQKKFLLEFIPDESKIFQYKEKIYA